MKTYLYYLHIAYQILNNSSQYDQIPTKSCSKCTSTRWERLAKNYSFGLMLLLSYRRNLFHRKKRGHTKQILMMTSMGGIRGRLGGNILNCSQKCAHSQIVITVKVYLGCLLPPGIQKSPNSNKTNSLYNYHLAKKTKYSSLIIQNIT